MKQSNPRLLQKFEVIKRWMINDLDRAMFSASANFLVAQGLLMYTEIVGSFLTGNGNDSGKNFDTFFERLGLEYKKLLKRHNKRRKRPHVVYDDLRCGMLHEYIGKRKGFVVYNAPNRISDQEIRAIRSVEFGNRNININSGVIHIKVRNKGFWLIIDPVFWLDFKVAFEQYWTEINDPANKTLRKLFFQRARQINLRDHII